MLDKKRIIIISSAIILLCTMIITGATFALFTEDKTVTTHLQAGGLDVQFYRNSYSYTLLNADGTLTPVSGGTRKDFTQPVDENFFGFKGTNDDKFKIVPETTFSADMQLVNNGTTAFTYDIDIVYDTTDNENSNDLSGQLWVTVGTYAYNGLTRVDTITKEAYLNDPVWETAEGYLAGTLTLDSEEKVSENMFVKVKFMPSDANNDVMGDSVYFDLVLKCVQYNG